MAKAPAKQEEPVAPKVKKKLLIFIIATVVVVLVLAGGAVLLLKKSSNSEGDEDAAKTSRHELAPVFVRLEPFTVKLQPFEDKPDQYLQLVPELKVINVPAGDRVKLFMPEIRHNMLLILSSKNSGELSSPQGVEKLSTELRTQTNQILGSGDMPKGAAPADDKAIPKGAAPAVDKAGPEDPVQAVLFTSFIIQ